jgi:hypothetical protein
MVNPSLVGGFNPSQKYGSPQPIPTNVSKAIGSTIPKLTINGLYFAIKIWVLYYCCTHILVEKP